jgi:ribosomal protein S17E
MRTIEREIIIRAVFNTLKKYKNIIKGNCEPISRDITSELLSHKMIANHAVGNFILDKPDAKKYMGKYSDKVLDDYQVNHDWIEVGPFIIDATIKQFQPSILEKLPEIGFFGANDHLSNRYSLKKYYE